MKLHPFQIDVVERAEQYQRPLIVLPTGAGKTVVASEIVKRNPNSHVLFFAHRRELVFHAQDKLAAFGVISGLIMAGQPRHLMRGVQVASIQTLHARCMRGDADLPPAEIVIIDEAHRVAARTYQQIIAAYQNARIIGLTATPCRRDGRGLGGTFDRLIEGPAVQKLIDGGHLVPTVVYAPNRPDLNGVRSRGGDYVKEELERRMNRAELVGDICETWFRLADGRKTVVFASGVKHSVHVRNQFRAADVLCEHIDGDTPKDERDRILRRLAIGDLQVLTNCDVLSEGWDCPAVSCIVLARPTRSIGRFRQMVGRVLRPHEGKTDALVLDHAGATFSHGFVEDAVAWSLKTTDKAQNKTHEARGTKKEPGSRLLDCKRCGALRVAGKPCTACGYMPTPPPQAIQVGKGDLAQIERDGTIKPTKHRPDDWLAQLMQIGLDRGYRPGWARHKYREKFGVWPDRWNVDPQEPTPEVWAWVRSRQIAFAKMKAAQRGSL